MIQDSGNRREFDTGAVRDIQEGKGRCDLLPLDVVSNLKYFEAGSSKKFVLVCIEKYMRTGEETILLDLIAEFSMNHFGDIPTAVLEVAKHFEEGCNKYGERNWQKGIPLHCYIDSAIRHYLKFLRGDDDERHDRAFLWNLLCCLWTQKNKPELIDLPFAQNEDK